MAHNGILHIPCVNRSMSDTWHLARMLEPILTAHPDYLANDRAMKDLGDAIGHGNKLAFIDGAGHITIVNEELGVWSDDGATWYSNEYSLPRYREFFTWDARGKRVVSFGFGAHTSDIAEPFNTLPLTEAESINSECDYCGLSGPCWYDHEFDAVLCRECLERECQDEPTH
jgi:hypothetical protein